MAWAHHSFPSLSPGSSHGMGPAGVVTLGVGQAGKRSSQITASSWWRLSASCVSSEPPAVLGLRCRPCRVCVALWGQACRLLAPSSEGAFLRPVPGAAAQRESAFRLSLAWAQALAAQRPAELLWLGASHQV